jgi:hypothetical protein
VEILAAKLYFFPQEHGYVRVFKHTTGIPLEASVRCQRNWFWSKDLGYFPCIELLTYSNLTYFDIWHEFPFNRCLKFCTSVDFMWVWIYKTDLDILLAELISSCSFLLVYVSCKMCLWTCLTKLKRELLQRPELFAKCVHALNMSGSQRPFLAMALFPSSVFHIL